MNRILNNNLKQSNITFNSKKSEENNSMEDTIQSAINKLVQRGQREMPEYGDFAPIIEKFTNTDDNLKIGEPSIKIVYANYNKDKTLKRLELDIPSKSGLSKANIAMELADKKDILDVLSDENLKNRIEKNMQKVANEFKDGNYA